MKKTVIKRNSNGDSRTAKGIPTLEEFKKANREHIKDVEAVMSELAFDIEQRGRIHDHTKISYEDMFYNDLCETMNGHMKFENGEWAKLHYSTERHHLMRNVPDDVNLIDVIEMIADCVCAGMARSGEVRPLEIDESILTRALHNTEQLIKDSIELIEDEDEIPKNAELEISEGEYAIFLCPNCHEIFHNYIDKPHYCEHCGQAIDWSDNK